MRVVCTSIDDFLENLKGELPDSILRKTIYVSTTKRPVGDNPRQAVKFIAEIHASAIIDLTDGGQYLLDYGENCGIDYHDASKEMAGTATANTIRSQLKTYCDEVGLVVRPGIVDAN